MSYAVDGPGGVGPCDDAVDDRAHLAVGDDRQDVLADGAEELGKLVGGAEEDAHEGDASEGEGVDVEDRGGAAEAAHLHDVP